MSDFANIMTRLINTPLLVQNEYLVTVLNLISQRRENDGFGALNIFDENGAALNVASTKRYSSLTSKDERYVHDGIAVVGVLGSTAHKPGQLSAGMSSSMRTYQGILSDTRAAMEDDRVKGIMFHHNSPGGEASGCFSTTSAIMDMRGQKPMWSLVDELSASASYNLAAAADRIVGPSEMQVGSIGAVIAHTSIEKALKKAGVNVTLIASGTEKTLGTPTKDLSDDVKAKLQSRTNEMGFKFGEFIAQNRNLEHDAVMALEAAVLSGDDALQAGLADEFMSVDDAFGAFAEHLNGASLYPSEGVSMSKENGVEADAKVAGEESTALETATAAHEADMARVKGIHALESANVSAATRKMAAIYADTNMTVEQADEALKASAEQSADLEVESGVADDDQRDVAGELLASSDNGTDELNADLDASKVGANTSKSKTDNIVSMFAADTGSFFGKSQVKVKAEKEAS